jgi:hypothetical protein
MKLFIISTFLIICLFLFGITTEFKAQTTKDIQRNDGKTFISENTTNSNRSTNDIQWNRPPKIDDTPRVYQILTAVEFWLSLIILLLAIIVILVEFYLLKATTSSADDLLRVFVITLIVFGTLFLITAGYSSNQIAPAMGLFGTIAGYLIGKGKVEK